MNYDLSGYTLTELTELRDATAIDIEGFRGVRKWRDSLAHAEELLAQCETELTRRAGLGNTE